MSEWCIGLYSSLFAVENAVEKSCCRGPLQQLYTTHALSHGPISIQQLYSIQLYSSYTVYILYSIPLSVIVNCVCVSRARRVGFFAYF